MNNITYAFLLCSLAGLSTMLGCIVIFIKNKSNKILIASLAFAAGVMTTVSITDLIPESLHYLKTYLFSFPRIIVMLICICIGIILSMTIDKYLPENKANNSKLYRVGIISMLAIILHNIPEGIATFMTSSTNIKIGLSLSIAIALHNIPEGISISMPIYSSTKSKFKAILYTFISALSEPFGAIIAFLFLKDIMNNLLMGMLLAMIAGIMLHISFYELLPESLSYNNKKLSILFFIIGVLFMFINHFIF